MRKIKTLPAMKCEEGCGRCCGIVPATETEYQRVIRYAKEHDVNPQDQGITCPWYQENKCSVYAVRPIICRLFGHVEAMPCPQGHNVSIPEREAVRMIRSNGKCGRVLHEVLPGWNALFAARFAKATEAQAQEAIPPASRDPSIP